MGKNRINDNIPVPLVCCSKTVSKSTNIMVCYRQRLVRVVIQSNDAYITTLMLWVLTVRTKSLTIGS